MPAPPTVSSRRQFRRPLSGINRKQSSPPTPSCRETRPDQLAACRLRRGTGPARLQFHCIHEGLLSGAAPLCATRVPAHQQLQRHSAQLPCAARKVITAARRRISPKLEACWDDRVPAAPHAGRALNAPGISASETVPFSGRSAGLCQTLASFLPSGTSTTPGEGATTSSRSIRRS